MLNAAGPGWYECYDVLPIARTIETWNAYGLAEEQGALTMSINASYLGSFPDKDM
jgi:hypothetical protein